MADWQEKFGARLSLLMDGNGATCSRVSISLTSNSILMKYNSTSQIYYFSSLVSRLHYVTIPISENEDVIKFVREEQAEPTKYKFIAEAHKEISRKQIIRDAEIFYTTLRSRQYSDLFRVSQKPSCLEIPSAAKLLTTRCAAHIGNIADVHENGVGIWIGHANSELPLESFLFSIDDEDSRSIPIDYRIRSNGVLSD